MKDKQTAMNIDLACIYLWTMSFERETLLLVSDSASTPIFVSYMHWSTTQFVSLKEHFFLLRETFLFIWNWKMD